jgi:lactoylglutathione lyase
MIKYGYTILYVENVEQTLAFYQKAFGLTRQFITPEKDYGELNTGNTTLAFALYTVAEYNGIKISKSNINKPFSPFELTFVSNAIELDFKTAVNAGAIVIKSPEAKPWGQVVGYVKDINGFLIELCTPIEK